MRVKQRMNGAFVRLLLVYAALEAFRHSGWMLFYEQVVEAPRQVVNTGFILYSGAIALTALLAPRCLSRLGRWEASRATWPVFLLCVCGAVVLRGVQWLVSPPVAATLLVLWTVAVMVAICLCFALVLRQIPRSHLGRFFGIAYCLDAGIVSFIEQFTGTATYPFVSQLLGVALCSVAIWLFRLLAVGGTVVISEDAGADLSDAGKVKPTPRLVGFTVAVGCLYALMAGAMDNLYFFDDWLALPYVGLFTLPMMACMYLAGGFLYDKVHWRVTVPVAIACVCLAQTMPFFAPLGVFAYAYSVFSGMGTTFLQLVVVTLPILAVRATRGGTPPEKTDRLATRSQPAGAAFSNSSNAPLGEGVFYAGFCLSSIAFQFASQAAYRPVMGAILLAGVVCLMMMIEVIALHEKQKHQDALARQQLAMAALRERVTATGTVGLDGLSLVEAAANVRFTKREKELMPFIASALTAEEIAAQTHVSVSTIRFHIRNILDKTGARNRRELMRLFVETRPVEETK